MHVGFFISFVSVSLMLETAILDRLINMDFQKLLSG
jgi:hypothetical protein